jgi:dipeptidyl aminopeptidase/acylaminoacyl peptidase
LNSRTRLLLALLLPLAAASAGAETRRPLALEDFYALRTVSDVALSADGRWAVYVVTEIDRARDARVTSVMKVEVAGGAPVALTRSAAGDRLPSFSPDGRWVAFVSNREAQPWGIARTAAIRGQIFLLPVGGGEAFPVTALPGGVSSYAWSPDGRRLAVVGRDPLPDEERGSSSARPIVLTRLRHKAGTEYLDARKQHLYVVDLDAALPTSGVQRGQAKLLMPGSFDEQEPAWSPDGRRIAFTSNRTQEPDANRNTDIWIVEVGSLRLHQITTDPGADARAAWSPDGSTLAYVHTPTSPPLYAIPRLQTIAASGGAPRDLTGRFDRPVSSSPSLAGVPRWSSDGGAIYIAFADRGRTPLCRVGIDGSKTTVIDGDVQQWEAAARQAVAIVLPPDAPAEVYSVNLEGRGAPRALSRANGALVAGLNLPGAESIEYPSTDGARVHGWLLKPPAFDPGRRYPLVVWIHGGPVWHWTEGFKFEPQYFAALGYVVLLPNPRGSIGYGEAFSKVLFADWGNKDYQDVIAGVDHLVRQGVVDGARVGVGGWSYGGVLTNYIITKTGRFKAAISGAGHSDLLSSFGTDDARLAWIEEFGYPWDNLDLYRKLSPITQVKNVVTPTLFVYGERDFNCSPAQAEQMYVSLKTLGKEAALILYPGEGHRIDRPESVVDRARRYGLWFDKHLRGRDVDPLYNAWPSVTPAVR